MSQRPLCWEPELAALFEPTLEMVLEADPFARQALGAQGWERIRHTIEDCIRLLTAFDLQHPPVCQESGYFNCQRAGLPPPPPLNYFGFEDHHFIDSPTPTPVTMAAKCIHETLDKALGRMLHSVPHGSHVTSGNGDPESEAKRKPLSAAEVEIGVANGLRDHPEITRDALAKLVGDAGARISNSLAWKTLRPICTGARRAARARGRGGVGDPSVDHLDRSDDE